MRRLLLLVSLLALPATARADYEPYLSLYGCNISVCTTVVWSSQTIDLEPPVTLYQVDVSCSASAASQVYCPNRSTDHLILTTGNGVTYAGYITLDFNLGLSEQGPPPDVLGGIYDYRWGRVLESGPGQGGPGAIVLTTTPEPATMLLLGSGLFGVFAVRRRRHQ